MTPEEICSGFRTGARDRPPMVGEMREPVGLKQPMRKPKCGRRGENVKNRGLKKRRNEKRGDIDEKSVQKIKENFSEKMIREMRVDKTEKATGGAFHFRLTEMIVAWRIKITMENGKVVRSCV